MSKDAAISQWKEYPFWAVAKPKSVSNTSAESLLSVYLDRGVIPYSEGGGLVHKPAESLEKYQLVEPGDLVLNNQQAWRGSLGVSTYRGIVSPAYRIFELNEEVIDTRFSHYLFRSRPYVDKIMLASLSVGDIQRQVKWPLLKVLSLRVPNISIQSIIAEYLDRETARIDGLIEKKTRFIALLKEKRAAVITHAVTKGIDAGGPMKASGQGWLGDIPAHWSVVPPTALFTESKERAREGSQMLSATQKYGVIPLAEFERLEQRQVTMAVVHLDKRKHVEVGDFVISMRSMDGGLERARAVGSVRSSYSVLRCGPDVEGRFYGHLLKSGLYIQALRLTSSFIRDGQDMNFSHFRKVKLPKLPLAEQAAIADHIDTQTARIDSLITKTDRSIALLREKRAALITAAVTGKIDVRGQP